MSWWASQVGLLGVLLCSSSQRAWFTSPGGNSFFCPWSLQFSPPPLSSPPDKSAYQLLNGQEACSWIVALQISNKHALRDLSNGCSNERGQPITFGTISSSKSARYNGTSVYQRLLFFWMQSICEGLHGSMGESEGSIKALPSQKLP